MTDTNPSTQEKWKPVPEWEGFYEVSDHGCLRIDATRTHWRARRNNGILKLSPNSHGYCRVKLRHKKRQAGYSVHGLVMLAFVGPRPEGLEINHKNGIKTDNRLENLEYVSTRENHHHSVELGLTKITGDDHWKRRMAKGINTRRI